jgi:hypothetical protein
MINFCSLRRVLVFLQLHAGDQTREQAWLMMDRREFLSMGEWPRMGTGQISIDPYNVMRYKRA